MKQAIIVGERLIWTLSGLICLWAAWDTHRRGGDVLWIFGLAIVGMGFLAYTVYHIQRSRRDSG
ncbi:MAG: hypothetical protein RLP44_20200 [Aggregatilineales bacterium]